MSPTKTNVKKSNVKPILLVGLVLLGGAYAFMNYDNNQPTSFGVSNEQKSGVDTNLQHSKVEPSSKPEFKIPVRTNIDKSIDILASQIVAGSPNQHEGFSALTESKSLRVQRIKTRRAEEREKEAQANYNANLLAYKSNYIPEIVAKELSNSDKEEATNRSVKSESGTYRNHRAIEKDDELNAKSEIELSDFKLRAIIQDSSDKLMARLSFKGRRLSAKAGDNLMSTIKVNSVANDKVVLTKGAESLSLYAY